MTGLPPALRRFHRGSLRIALLRRSLLWSTLSIACLALWTCLCVLFRLPRAWQEAAVIGTASLLPAFLFWPLGRRTFLLPLRDRDRETASESYFEARGETRSLLERRLEALGPRLDRRGGTFREATKGLFKPALFAASSLCLLQLVAILTLSHPLILWDGGVVTSGSGLRLAEAKAQARTPSAARLGQSTPPDRSGREAVSSQTAQEAEKARSTATGDRSLRAIQGELGASGKATGKGDSNSSTSGSPPSESAPPPKPQAPSGTAASTGSTGAGMPNPGKGGQEGVTGYEGRGASGVPSPLIDYRTKLFKELMSREGRNLRASGELVTTPFPELQRRWFSSFEMSADIGPREDAWTALLRRKWAQLWLNRGSKK